MGTNMDVNVSIIVPIYNVEKYLRTCLDSLINQTLKNIEIILINDCSTDNSETIILEYKSRDSRIVYLKHKVNQGQGIARNNALKVTKGEFVLFVDSDDYIALDAAEVLYNKAKPLNLDILEANYYRIFPKHKTEQSLSLFPEILTGNEYFERVPFTVGVVWNKLWNTNFIKANNLNFVKEIFEDVRFFSEATLYADRVLRIEYSFYNYIIRNNSTMTSTISEKHLFSQMKLLKFLEKSYNENTGVLGSNQRFKLLLYSFSNLATFISKYRITNDFQKGLKKEAKYLLDEKHKFYRRHIFQCDKLGLKQKIIFFISPYLMSFIINKFKNS